MTQNRISILSGEPNTERLPCSRVKKEKKEENLASSRAVTAMTFPNGDASGTWRGWRLSARRSLPDWGRCQQLAFSSILLRNGGTALRPSLAASWLS